MNSFISSLRKDTKRKAPDPCVSGRHFHRIFCRVGNIEQGGLDRSVNLQLTLRRLQALVEKIADGSLAAHIGVTLGETVLGFLLGTLLGTCLAALLWWSNRLARVLDPYLVILNAMPKVALGPILIVALGPNFTSIVAMGAVISVIITTIVVFTAFQEVDENYIKVMKTFGAKRSIMFKEVILPACAPAIISALKVNVGLSWVGVIVGEFLVSEKGLGYMIIYGFQVFNFTLVFLSLLIIAIFATLMYQGVELLERKWTKGKI